MVILAVALEAQADAADVRRTLGISCSTEGFFLEKHPKLAPVNTANDGVLLAGACQGAKDIPDTVAQADAAAAKALALIDAGQIELEPNTAWIDEEMCSGCKTCILAVPLQGDHRRRGAEDRRDRRGLVQGLRHVRGRLPLGRRQAASVFRRTNPRGAGRVDELCLILRPSTAPEFRPRIVAFLCNWCSYTASDLAGTARIKYSPCARIIRVMCSGRVDPTFVLKAFALGADGVMIAGCHPGDCHYIEQNYKTIRRHADAPAISWSRWGSSPTALRLVWASAAEGQYLAESIDPFVAEMSASWAR